MQKNFKTVSSTDRGMGKESIFEFACVYLLQRTILTSLIFGGCMATLSSMPSEDIIKDRAHSAKEHCWDVEALYPSWDAWEDEMKRWGKEDRHRIGLRWNRFARRGKKAQLR